MPIWAAAGAIGSEMRVLASGIGDEEDGVQAVRLIEAHALRPPAPVHVQAQRDSDVLVVRWVRRSRLGWSWTDGADAPQGEESERYLVELASAGEVRRVETADPECVFDGLPAHNGEAATIVVRQQGTHAPSLPATLNLTL